MNLEDLSKTRTDRPVCECNICKRSREFYRICYALPEAEQEWMYAMYDSFREAEAELEMLQTDPRPPPNKNAPQ